MKGRLDSCELKDLADWISRYDRRLGYTVAWFFATGGLRGGLYQEDYTKRQCYDTSKSCHTVLQLQKSASMPNLDGTFSFMSRRFQQ